jgi:uncharacterized repeat protein (TIGR03833 family)
MIGYNTNHFYVPDLSFSQPDGRKRSNLQPGLGVKIVEKRNQKSGLLTEGTVETILTNSPEHPHGIKVRLKERGVIGRVKEVLDVGAPMESKDMK